MNKLPSPKTMYPELVNRDTNFEGIFYAGVKTTGIFCRSICSALTPRAESVEYFPSPEEATSAGYRPCLRCRPLDNFLQARWIETPLGEMLALANQDGLHLLEFADRPGLESEITSLRARIKSPIVPGNSAHLDRIAQELQNYFQGREVSFTVPPIVGGSAFERQVWEKLQTIPPGQTRSYAQLAQSIGNPRAVRAVGRANSRNFLAVAIPCHRVIRADGNLCGYSGGLWRKQWLLEHERKIAGQATSGGEPMTPHRERNELKRHRT